MSPSSEVTDALTRATTIEPPVRQAFQILHWGFVAAPVLAGLDKFFNLLTAWEHYLAPSLAKLSPLSAHATMMAVGVVEIIAGLLVAFRPRIGAPIVAAWLAAIIMNLLMLGNYFDVALRDFGLFLGAIALGRLSVVCESESHKEATVHGPRRHAWGGV
ncbi:MAG: hypothetical protein QM778_17280 [Myxococcales bacterium]